MQTKLNLEILEAIASLTHQIARYRAHSLITREGAEEARLCLGMLQHTLEQSIAEATAQWDSDVRKVHAWKAANS